MNLNFCCFMKRFLTFKNHTVIDNAIFRLHYKSSVWLLIICGLIIVIREYNSDSIDCVSSEFSLDLVNSFCWTHETFFDAKKFLAPNNALDFVRKNASIASINVRSDYFEFHWSGYLLLIQAIFFYLPHQLWILFENSKLQNLLTNINDERLKEEKREDSIQKLVSYLVKNVRNHQIYSLLYIIVEIVNLLNVIIQIVICNCFLNGHFIGLGLQIFAERDDYTLSPFEHVFPRSAICPFYGYNLNTKGEASIHYILCLLPINLLNEKIFLFLWYWYVVLVILTACGLLHHIACYLFSSVRLISLRSDAHFCDTEQLDSVMRRCKFGDWFLLKLIVKNIDSNHFSHVISNFSKKYTIKRSGNSETVV